MKKKILIIDELSPYLYFIKRVLINEGYEVSIADSEPAYMSYLNNYNPDLVFIDVKINNNLGFKYLKHIKKNMYTDIPIIVISGEKNLKEIEMAFDYGAYDYLIKPLNLRDMKNKAIAAIEKEKINN